MSSATTTAYDRSARVPAKAAVKNSKHNVGHPATCDRVYDDPETAFLNAMTAFKRKSGRQFPLVTDYLRVLLEMGYCKPKPTCDTA